jgi:hypothetical protein
MNATLNASKHHTVGSGTLCAAAADGIDANQFCPILLRSPALTVPFALKSPDCQVLHAPVRSVVSRIRSPTLFSFTAWQ